MSRSVLLSALLLPVVLSAGARADHRAAGSSYPRVRTHTGSYYGPTQAHYQYFRRYGRPWHGQGGLSGGAEVGFVNGYPGGWSGWGGWGGDCSYGSCGWGLSLGGFSCGFDPYCSGGWGYSAPWPAYGGYFDAGWYAGGPVTSPGPLSLDLMGPLPSAPGVFLPLEDREAVREALRAAREGRDPLLQAPAEQPPAVKPSSPQAQLRSLRHQQHGDVRLGQLDYRQAYLRYRDAIEAAPDRAEPHIHIAIALAGMKDFQEAAASLKRGLALDPQWVRQGHSLDDLLGEQHLVAKVNLKQRVAEWALEDVRDADRLFLLGALLHMDGDPERARILLETAELLVGPREHLVAFLQDDVGRPELMPGGAAPRPERADTVPERPGFVPDIPELPARPGDDATPVPEAGASGQDARPDQSGAPEAGKGRSPAPPSGDAAPEAGSDSPNPVSPSRQPDVIDLAPGLLGPQFPTALN